MTSIIYSILFWKSVQINRYVAGVVLHVVATVTEYKQAVFFPGGISLDRIDFHSIRSISP